MSTAGKTLFVTGSDTGVGKTLATAALLRAIKAQGRTVCGFKPVAAGAIDTPRGRANEDVLILQQAAGTREPLQRINPCLLQLPVAPHLAAAAEQRRIRISELDDAHAVLAARYDVVVAEGAGGWLVPFDEVWTLGEWVAERDWPVILVVGMRLGCLNHALLSAEAIVRRTRLVGWIANVLPPAMSLLEENIATLEHRLAAPLLGVIPEGADAARAAAALDRGRLRQLLR